MLSILNGDIFYLSSQMLSHSEILVNFLKVFLVELTVFLSVQEELLTFVLFYTLIMTRPGLVILEFIILMKPQYGRRYRIGIDQEIEEDDLEYQEEDDENWDDDWDIGIDYSEDIMNWIIILLYSLFFPYEPPRRKMARWKRRRRDGGGITNDQYYEVLKETNPEYAEWFDKEFYDDAIKTDEYRFGEDEVKDINYKYLKHHYEEGMSPEKFEFFYEDLPYEFWEKDDEDLEDFEEDPWWEAYHRGDFKKVPKEEMIQDNYMPDKIEIKSFKSELYKAQLGGDYETFRDKD